MTAFYQSATSSSSQNDMFNGVIGDMSQTGGINATPVYAAGNGWTSESGGLYALAAGTPGYDQGVRIANFNDCLFGRGTRCRRARGRRLGDGLWRRGFGRLGRRWWRKPAAAGAVTFSGAVSRKTHGSAGTFDITLDTTQAISSAVTVEPRAIGSGHKIVFQFSGAITAAGTVTTTDLLGAAIGSATATAVGNTVEVTITGVADAKRVRVALAGVNGSVSAATSIGFLVGDVNDSRSVTSADINRVKGKTGSAVSASTFMYDVDASGAINATDTSTVKQRSGLTI
jgi:hypothetical protein